MKPDSPEHNALADRTPGTDGQERGMIECPECGAETEANRAAVAVKEAYTCPECEKTTEFDNHLGTFFLVLVLMVVLTPFYKAYLWLRSKLPGRNGL